MKFRGKESTTVIMKSGNKYDVDIDYFIRLLKNVTYNVGEETRKKLHDVIDSVSNHGYVSYGDDVIQFQDTPIYGRFYVYLWFDENGDLFYIGKGSDARVVDLRNRSELFCEKAKNGRCEIIAANMNEGYALDLENILILESKRLGLTLLNNKSCDGLDAVEYCTRDRDHLLWYWDHLGVITRFSELCGMNIWYDARGYSGDALDERCVWWESHRNIKTNNPEILEAMRKSEEKKEKQRESRRRAYVKRKERLLQGV